MVKIAPEQNLTIVIPTLNAANILGATLAGCAPCPVVVADGGSTDGTAELARFCRIAMGSASELEYHLLLAHDLGLLPDIEHGNLNERVTEVKRMLTAFTQKLTADG